MFSRFVTALCGAIIIALFCVTGAFADSQCEVTTTDGHNACVPGHTHHHAAQKPVFYNSMADYKAHDPVGYAKRQAEIAAELREYRAEDARRAEQRRQSYASSGSGCGNPYGGPRAPGGEFMCSNQGEILACRCNGNSCTLIHTGAIQCTRPGSVFR